LCIEANQRKLWQGKPQINLPFCGFEAEKEQILVIPIDFHRTDFKVEIFTGEGFAEDRE